MIIDMKAATPLSCDMNVFTANKRKVCPFLESTLSVQPDKGKVSLLLSGPKVSKDFLLAALQEVFSG